MTSKSFRTIITKPTRITDSSQTLIDHIWINDMSDNKIDAKIVICDITDHLPIFYVKYGAEKKQGYSKITYRPLTENNIAKFKDAGIYIYKFYGHPGHGVNPSKRREIKQLAQPRKKINLLIYIYIYIIYMLNLYKI